MKALVYGVPPEEAAPPADPANPLLEGLARVPMRLEEIPDPRPLGPGWVVARTRLTGICGSDAKQVFSDFGDTTGTALGAWFSLPQVLGHEVVATVEEPADGGRLRAGQRVVLNPWLSCVPRGIERLCPSCEAGDLSLCEHFADGPIAPGIHTGTSKDATGGWAELLPAHESMLIPVPDGLPDEVAVFADPFAVSLHAVTRNPQPRGGRALIWGHGALGTCTSAILRALHPDVEFAVVARFPAQAELARRLGASLVLERPEERLEIIERVTEWAGGRVVRSPFGLPMAHPGGVDVVYDTIGKAETLEAGVRVLRARGTLVQSGVHGCERWDSSPLYFKEIHLVGSNAFGFEEVEGIRRHGIEHYLELARAGRVDLSGMLTHVFRLEQWREAFVTLATQATTGAIKVAFDFR